MTHLTAEPLGHKDFAGEITGFDAAAATPAELAEVRELLFRHRVLVLRDQRLTPDDYETFLGALGRAVPHVLQNLTVSGHPAILKISDYVPADGVPFGVLDGGSYWHADMSYLPQLGIATALYALRATERSGGTAFIDLAPAWELLSARADLLEPLGCGTGSDVLGVEIEHRFGNRDALTDTTAARQELTDDQHSEVTGARHRLVERHPVTGELGLFAPLGTPMAVAGLPAGRSDLALDRLAEFVRTELPTYTHRYTPGDLVLWDNMTTLHRGVGVTATGDFSASRLLHRINVAYA
jgi:taurine dioxygenase